MEAWAIARFDLGLSDEEWLGMTPRHLHALRLRQEQKMQREELLVGIISSTVANNGFRDHKRTITPESFMLHPFPPEPEKPVTGEDVMRAFAHVKARAAAQTVIQGRKFA
jgi:hypothetical protein